MEERKRENFVSKEKFVGLLVTHYSVLHIFSPYHVERLFSFKGESEQEQEQPITKSI